MHEIQVLYCMTPWIGACFMAPAVPSTQIHHARKTGYTKRHPHNPHNQDTNRQRWVCIEWKKVTWRYWCQSCLTSKMLLLWLRASCCSCLRVATQKTWLNAKPAYLNCHTLAKIVTSTLHRTLPHFSVYTWSNQHVHPGNQVANSLHLKWHYLFAGVANQCWETLGKKTLAALDKQALLQAAL